MAKISPLKDILKTVIGKLEEKEKAEETLKRIWEEVVGKAAAKHTRLVFIKSRRLVVNVSDSSWLYKLTLEKNDIIEKYNKKAEKKKRIKKLHFRIGNIAEKER